MVASLREDSEDSEEEPDEDELDEDLVIGL